MNDMNELTEYQQRTDSYNNDLYLGRIVWYALSEQSYVNHGIFCQQIHDSGMGWPMPGVVREPDLFRRVTTDAQRRRVPTDNPNTFINYNFREVGKDGDHIWRQLVAETVDFNGRRLDYRVIAEVVFTRSPLAINDNLFEDALDGMPVSVLPETLAIIANVRNAFNAQWNLLTPYTLREYVRRTLRQTGATVLRDGVYFVREDHAEQVAALDTIINAIPGAMLHSLPLIDDRKQRDMLRQAFEDESVGEIDKLINEVTELTRSDKKITSNRFGEYLSRYNDLRAKVVEYSDLLDTAMELTAARLEVMNATLTGLLDQVK